MNNYAICAIIPTFNNASTICDVVLRTTEYIPDIIVVIDGSTDDTQQKLNALNIPLIIISYKDNKGKGYALKMGFKKAIKMGYTHAITIDGDGQHFPEDIPLLLNQSIQYPKSYVIGNRTMNNHEQPRKNSLANHFSNFWFCIQTFVYLKDTQSGMRIYPLEHLHGLFFLTNRYEAELAVLVFALWANEPIRSVPIRVYYPPEAQRISHFYPIQDFTRITFLNTILTVTAFIFGLPYKYWHKLKRKILPLVFLGLFFIYQGIMA